MSISQRQIKNNVIFLRSFESNANAHHISDLYIKNKFSLQIKNQENIVE